MRRPRSRCFRGDRDDVIGPRLLQTALAHSDRAPRGFANHDRDTIAPIANCSVQLTRTIALRANDRGRGHPLVPPVPWRTTSTAPPLLTVPTSGRAPPRKRPLAIGHAGSRYRGTGVAGATGIRTRRPERHSCVRRAIAGESRRSRSGARPARPDAGRTATPVAVISIRRARWRADAFARRGTTLSGRSKDGDACRGGGARELVGRAGGLDPIVCPEGDCRSQLDATVRDRRRSCPRS